MNSIICYHCHFWNEHIARAWKKLVKESGRQCFLLFDTTNSAVPSGIERLIPVNLESLRQAGYPVHNLGFWHNPEFALLEVYHRLEGDLFWRLDHDVRFTGNWKDFFDSRESKPSSETIDFIGTGFSTPSDEPDLAWWNSDCGTLGEFRKLKALACINRFSRKFLDLIDLKYRSGTKGFGEIVVGTLAEEVNCLHDKTFVSPDLFVPGPIRSGTNSVSMLEHPIREEGIRRLEVDSCRDALAKYCTGTGLDLGFGGRPILPTSITIDHEEGHPGRPSVISPSPTHIVGDPCSLPWFADNSMDYVFSSHLLEDYEDTIAVLKEWWRVIKPGGNLVLFLPDQPTYEKYCKDRSALPNGAHKHSNFSRDYIMACMVSFAGGDVLLSDWPVPYNPYSFSLVLRKPNKCLTIPKPTA